VLSVKIVAYEQFFNVRAFYSKLPTNNYFLQAWSDVISNLLSLVLVTGLAFYICLNSDSLKQDSIYGTL
jgi:hypothetical protein